MRAPHTTHAGRREGREVARTVARRPFELLARKGEEHEQAWLRKLQADGRAVLSLQMRHGRTGLGSRGEADDVRPCAQGVEIIYQGVLLDDGWRGIADFLIRVDAPSALGPWSYEVWDTSWPVKASRISPCSSRSTASNWRGSGSGARVHARRTRHTGAAVPSVRGLRRLLPTVKRRFLRAVAERRDTYPYPFRTAPCATSRRSVSGGGKLTTRSVWSRAFGASKPFGSTRRRQHGRGARGTGADLSVRIGAPTLPSLRRQAVLQTQHRITGVHTYELIPPGPDPGFALLPEPTGRRPVFRHGGIPVLRTANGWSICSARSGSSDAGRSSRLLGEGSRRRAQGL